jgi:histidinol-phosphatase
MYQRELAFAHEVAERAAFIGTGLFRSPELEVRHKADATFVTRADTTIETMIREAVAEAFPGDRVLGEEEGGSRDPAGRLWIVDPIDATANFARGVPIWGTLIALQVDGLLVLGMANAPALGERYAAVHGEGATMNGEPIRVSDIGHVGDAHVLFSELKDLLGGPYAQPTVGLARDCWRDRAFGDFWANMLVARGAADVMLEPSLAVWDYAAPKVIVEEAGGRMTTFDGREVHHGSSVLTTNGSLHDEILRRLAMPSD